MMEQCGVTRNMPLGLIARSTSNKSKRIMMWRNNMMTAKTKANDDEC